MLQQLLAADPELQRFSTEEKKRLFAIWSERDPLDQLLRSVQTHPEWLEFAWPGVARYHAGRHEYEEAWQLVRRYALPPALPQYSPAPPLAQLAQKLSRSPDDYAAGYALFRAQFDAGKTDDALATLRHFTSRPDSPAYFHYLLAEACAAKEHWERAWQSWQEYQRRSR